jgi:20S proteasome subunit beta 4
MECLFGIAGPSFCLLAADTTVSRSIVVMKQNHLQKFTPLTSTTLLAHTGEPGDASNYADLVSRNVQLEKWRWDGRELGVHEAASFCRKMLADSLRSRTPYNVNVLIGGVDGCGRGHLYWMDYLASMVQVPFGAHGYGAYFCTGLMDRLYKPDLTEEDAVELLRLCLVELKQRFIANLPCFHVKIVRADGTVSEVNMAV